MKLIICTLICSSLFFSPLTAIASNGDTITSEESNRILTRVFNKYIPIYIKYLGVESRSKVTTQEYDSVTNALKSTTEAILHRKDYFYEKPEVKAISFKKDGKDMDPSKYRSWETQPTYLAFDKKGTENYILKVTEKTKINNKECYRIEVLPRKATSRHFKGEIYFAVDTLDVVQIVGGAAVLEFPIKYFWSEFNFTPVNEVPVAQSGTFKVRVNIPVVYPNMLIVTSTTILESRLIENKKNP